MLGELRRLHQVADRGDAVDVGERETGVVERGRATDVCRSRPYRSSTPVGETSSATPTIAATPRVLTATRYFPSTWTADAALTPPMSPPAFCTTPMRAPST